MKVIYVYNPHNARERDLIQDIVKEMSPYVTTINVVDVQEAKEFYPITSTPALIIIREDLRGPHLLEENLDTSQLRLTLEVRKVLEEEEKNLFGQKTDRIDAVIKEQVKKQMSENYQVMLDMADILLESGVL